MSDQTIICTNCGEAIELTEALTEKINRDLRANLKIEFDKKHEEEKRVLQKEARERAEGDLKLELDDLNKQLRENALEIDEFQKQELDLRKKARELEKQKKEVELDVERRIAEERRQIEQNVECEIEEKHRLNDRAKDKQLTDLMRQLEDAQRKAKQGSQQMQGEVAELELEEQLSTSFSFDLINPVPKGIRGADAIQTVRNESLAECGTIIWEFKRTKTWAKTWIPKLKDDQREVKADVAVIVSEAMPDGNGTIEQIDGVWVVGYKYAIGLASVLRDSLVRITASKSSEVGKTQKMELLYEYLYGPEFKHRVEAMVEAFGSMRSQLEKEKGAMNRLWAKREQEIDRYIKAVSGMYGDMEGIIGRSLPAINQFQLTDGDDEE